MNFELWKWAIWIVSTLGITGTIVAFAFYPSIVTFILKGIFSFFSFVLSYRLGCALVAALIAAAATDYARHSYDDKRFAAETAAFEQAQKDRDERITKEIRETVMKEVADSAADSAKIDQDVKEFHDALPPVPHVETAADNPYLVGADACKLRHIAGLAECESGSSEGVPKANPALAATRHLPKIRLPRHRPAIARPTQQGQSGDNEAKPLRGSSR